MECRWWRVDMILDGREGYSVRVFSLDDAQAKWHAMGMVEDNCPHAGEVVFWRVCPI